MIKRYHNFITEHFNIEEFNNTYTIIKSPRKNLDLSFITKLIKYRKQFAESIKVIPTYYSKFFSELSSSEAIPENDFNKIQKLIDKSGFTLDIIKKLFDPIISEGLSQNFNEFIQYYGLGDINGYVDIYLYMINEKLSLNQTIWLGGEGYSEPLLRGDENEFIIKYSYGQHRTPYGKLFLAQNNISVELFIETVFSSIKVYLQEHVFDNLSSIIVSEYTRDYSKNGVPNFDNLFKANNYVTTDDDRFIISYKELSDNFNKKTDNEFSKMTTPEYFKEKILGLLSMSLSNMNIQDTGDELIFND